MLRPSSREDIVVALFAFEFPPCEIFLRARFSAARRRFDARVIARECYRTSDRTRPPFFGVASQCRLLKSSIRFRDRQCGKKVINGYITSTPGSTAERSPVDAPYVAAVARSSQGHCSVSAHTSFRTCVTRACSRLPVRGHSHADGIRGTPLR